MCSEFERVIRRVKVKDQAKVAAWLAEAYPVTAQHAVTHARSADADVCLTAMALAHWRALERLPDCLTVSDGTVWYCKPRIPVLQYFAATCTLCDAYYGSDGVSSSICVECPLAAVRGGVPCFKSRYGECGSDGETNPYGWFMETNDPKPMIAWLTSALSHACANLRRRRRQKQKHLSTKKEVDSDTEV